MAPSSCPTCEELLSKLSAATDRLFGVGSDVWLASVWDANGSRPQDDVRIANARRLREECASIQQHLRQHQAARHLRG